MIKQKKNRSEQLNKLLRTKLDLTFGSALAITALLILLVAVLFYLVGAEQGKLDVEKQIRDEQIKEARERYMGLPFETAWQNAVKLALFNIVVSPLSYIVLAIVLLLHGFKLVGR